MLTWLRKPKRCVQCDEYSSSQWMLEKALHEMELRAVRAESQLDLLLAEQRRVEAPRAGGFLPLRYDDDDADVVDFPAAFDLNRRIDEVFGDGISLTEFIRRDEDRKRREREALEAERSEVVRELSNIK